MKFELQLETSAPVHVQIERFLQRQLQTGELATGQRLPSNAELARQWGVSCTDVQKAMARLTAAGLLDRAPRRGTFVKSPAEPAVIGILSKQNLAGDSAHFARAIVQSLQAQMAEKNWRCRVYDCFQKPKAGAQPGTRAAVQHFVQDHLHYAFRGLVEVNADIAYPDSFKPQTELPRVRYGVEGRRPDVAVNSYQFVSDSVKFLAGRGRKRVLFIRTQPVLPRNTSDMDGLYDAVRECGLPSPQVIQLEPLSEAQGSYVLEGNAYRRTLDLFREHGPRRGGSALPDGIVSSDDVATRGVALALVQLGMGVPGQVTVLTQACEGIHLHYGIPVVRYELLPAEIARQLLAILWKRMVGETLPPLPVIVPGRINAEEQS